MPRDVMAVGQRIFMVDVRSIKTNKLVCTQGPFSEKQAQKVKDEIGICQPRFYGDVRRAKPGEVGQQS